MTELAVVETTPKLAFSSRSQKTNLEKAELLEKEIADLEAANSGATAPQDSEQKAPEEKDEGLSKEGDNWKKRYSDLRKHMATKEKEWNQRLEELEAKANTPTNQALPQSKEEIEKWVKKYPDIARIVKGIAKEESEATGQEIGSRVKELEKLKEEISLEKAKNELLRRHPDFDAISESDDFIEWVEKAPKWVQTAIYDDLDVDSAASAIELYKFKKGIKPKNTEKDAAAAVKTRSNTTPVDDESKNWFSESKVSKMNMKEYAKHEEAILDAMKNGKFIYDMTNGR